MITVLPKRMLVSQRVISGELLLGLRYFRNYLASMEEGNDGELLLGLRYFRNGKPVLSVREVVNYYLVCGTSETEQ